MLAQQTAQRCQIGVVHPLRGKARRHSFQRLAHDQDLVQILPRQRCDPGAEIGFALNQPAPLQPADRLPQGATADAQVLGQGLLADAVARRQFAADDRGLQLPGDHVDQGLGRDGLKGHGVHLTEDAAPGRRRLG